MTMWSIDGSYEIRHAIDDKSLTDSQRLNVALNSFNKLADKYRWNCEESVRLTEENKRLRKKIKELKSESIEENKDSA